MHKKINKILLTLIAGIVFILTFSLTCGAKNNDEIKNFKTLEKGVLTVGTNATFPPFEFKDKDEDQEIKGFDVDLINKIAKKLNLKVKFVDMPFEGLLPALGNKIDLVIAGLTKTEEREKIVDFTKPYFYGKQSILTLKNVEIKQKEDLNNLTIATQIGTTANEFVKKLQDEGLNNIKIKEYDEYDIMTQDLVRKRVDCVVLDDIVAKNQFNKHFPELNLTQGSVLNCPTENYCIALPKGNEKLLSCVDEILNDIINSKEYTELEEKYINIKLKSEENEETKSSNSIVNQFLTTLVEKERYKLYLKGITTTLIISIFAAILGFFLGIILAVLKLTKNKNGKRSLIGKIANFYINIVRGTPILLQLLIMWLVVFKNFKNGVFVAIIAFGLNSAAYVAEIIRSGINSVGVGQKEAAESLGFGKFGVMFYIVLPQSIKNSIPSLCNEFISLIKETAIVGYVALDDLTRAAFSISAASYQTFMPLIIAALIYYIITKTISFILEKAMKRMN